MNALGDETAEALRLLALLDSSSYRVVVADVLKGEPRCFIIIELGQLKIAEQEDTKSLPLLIERVTDRASSE